MNFDKDIEASQAKMQELADTYNKITEKMKELETEFNKLNAERSEVGVNFAVEQKFLDKLKGLSEESQA